MKFQIPAKLAKPALKLQKASPKIMLVTGIVGVVGAGVLACKNTLKLSETLEPTEKLLELAHQKAELSEEYRDGEYKKDIIKLQVHTVLNVAKLYVPAVALAAVSITLITAAQVVQSRRTAAVTAAYAGLKEGYDRLRQQIIDKYGAEEEEKLRHGVKIVEEVQVGKDGKEKVVQHERSAGYSPYAMLFDEGNVNWTVVPENNVFFLTAQQNYFNNKLQQHGFVFLNEVYEALGFPKNRAGAQVGWVAGETHGDGYIDFGFMNERSERVRDFMCGAEGAIWLDFNVDGVILDRI
jgi:hypothetical protein